MRLSAILVWFLYWSSATVGYILSASAGYVPDCFPHVQGCTSISAAGRYGLSFFVYKAVMIPAASISMVFWILTHQWLRCLEERSKSAWMISGLGLLGAVAIIVYLTFLGSEGEVYRAMRRYGTIFFFLATFIAECLLTYRCWRIFGRNWIVNAKVVLCGLVCLELLVHGISRVFLEDTRWLDDSTEWRAASILTIYPVMTWLLWRKTEFELLFRSRQ